MRGETAGGGWTPLGSGPAAAVYSGSAGGVPVALKVFPARFDRATLSTVEKERGRLREVASALPVHAVDQLPDGRHALRMELCPQSLAALLSRVGRLGPADAAVLGHAVAAALAGAHAAGVVHGGVKPSNVLFRASGEPVLADFGVALRQAFPRDPMESLEFLAPETLRTETLDERTDLYGLGALLHLALTGRPPLPGRLGEPAGERVLRVLRTPVPAIHEPGVPVELSTVVGRLLAPDPANRPADAGWVADRLGEMIARLAPPAPVVEPPGAAPSDAGPSSAGPPNVAPSSAAPPDAVPPSAAPWSAEPAPEPAFDDFGGAPPVRLPPSVVAALPEAPPDPDDFPEPPPTGEPPGETQREAPGETPRGTGRRIRLDFVAGGLVAAAVAGVGLVMVLTSGSDDLTTVARTPPPAPAPAAAAPAVDVRLDQPADRGTQVTLTWSSSSGAVDYAVIVAPEGEPNKAVLAQRQHTLTVQVDPLRRYCFEVQATDSQAVYRSEPQAIRGAVCHR
ncbi:serine/threonine protein kinase [Amycolatopsis silviterrae]|uniref:non-specific serine/threonine protein kinase n=1 Tax=Amycolatopsis silviterrae TaxID=1656914 RepID=A0ABW5H4E0_9PSEU